MQLISAALLATIAGLLLTPYYSIPAGIGWPLAIGALLAAVFFRQKEPLAVVLLAVFFFLFSHLHYFLVSPDQQTLSSLVNGREKIMLAGEILAVRQYADGRTSLDLRLKQRPGPDSELPEKLSGDIRLYLKYGSEELLPGDRLEFRSRLKTPRLFGTPGEFNWPRQLAGEGIVATAWVENAEKLTITAGTTRSPEFWIAGWRRDLASAMQSDLPQQQAGMVRALILGESRMLPDQIRRLLARGGVSHLFAISGLHLGLLALFGYRLLFLVYRRSARLLLWQPPQRVLPVLLLPLLLAYLLLTGDAIATRRAFSLAVIGGGLLLWRRQVNPFQLLLSLALLFLLFNPFLLWQPSWQLSFSGAAGIILWRPIWQARMEFLLAPLQFFARLALVTLAATLATLPLVLVNFHLIAPAGLLANLICVPLVAFLALPLGVIGLLTFLFSPELAGYAFDLCGRLLDLVLAAVNGLTTVPFLQGGYLYLTPWQHLALGLLIAPVFWVPGRGYSLRTLTMVFTLSFVIAGLAWNGPYGELPRSQLIMFSVGQGESLLFTNASGQAILIDGGGLYSEHFDVGERLLAPALGYFGIRKLTAVILTHDHPDHRKGLNFILNEFSVGEFWSGESWDELFGELQSTLQKQAIPFRRIPAGWSDVGSWNYGKISLFTNTAKVTKENNRSLVLYWQAAEHGLLLTGDLEKEGVDRLLASDFAGPVTLLKLPHHGSRHSKSEKLVELLAPKICLASAGFQNRYHLPAQTLVDFLEEKEIPLYRTDLQGTVQASLFEAGWRVTTWEKGLFH